MRVLFFGAMAAMFLMGSAAARAADEAVRAEWTFENTNSAWAANTPGRKVWDVRDGAMVVTADGKQNSAVLRTDLHLDAKTANVVQVELESTHATRCHFTFSSGVSPAMDASKTLVFDLKPGAGPQLYAFDMRQHPAWADEILGVKFEFIGAEAGEEIKMRAARVFEADKISQPLSYTTATPLAPRPVRTFRLGSLFGDNMVLQRDARVPVWGRAPEGQTVTVRFRDRDYTATATKGRWQVMLDPTPVGGGALTLVARCGTNTVTCTNVLMGDVWFCSGQSNMGGEPAGNPVPPEREQELLKTDYPNLRFVRVPSRQRTTPLPNDAVEDPFAWSPMLARAQGGHSAVSYFFGQALHTSQNIPIGLIYCFVAGSQSEQWEDEATVASVYSAEERKRFRRMASAFYNGMVHPVAPYAFRGAIWYQGESNSDYDILFRNYHRSLPAMIANWRQLWGGAPFPFLIVQLPPFDGSYPPMSWAHVRDAQRVTAQTVTNVGLAVTFDTGDPKNLHPTNKFTVGERLARVARSMVYHEKIEGTGPLFTSMTKQNGRLVLKFSHVGSGLKPADSLAGFQVREGQGALVDAQARVIGPDTVEVWSDQVKNPTAAYYAWANAPVATLFSKDGLPASPFRTEPSEAP